MKFLSRLFSGSTPSWTPDEFWAWFVSPNGQRAAQDATSSDASKANRGQAALQSSLTNVNPSLSWGMRPMGKDGSPGVLEISAGGIHELIPEVIKVVEAAPKISGWIVVAFKQPSPEFSLSLGEGTESIDSQSVRVWARPAPTGVGDKYDITIYLPTPANFPEKGLAEIGFIVLDHILGEYNVMTRVGEVEFRSLLVAPPGVVALAEWADTVLK